MCDQIKGWNFHGHIALPLEKELRRLDEKEYDISTTYSMGYGRLLLLLTRGFQYDINSDGDLFKKCKQYYDTKGPDVPEQDAQWMLDHYWVLRTE